MVKYKLGQNGKCVIDTETNTYIPLDATYHRDWHAYQEWLAEGNKPAPSNTLTDEEIVAALTLAVQSFMDKVARERMYDGILSLCTYATSMNPKFAAEGQAGVAWRDAVWARCYALMDAVKAGEREIPTAEEIIAELPPFSWPDTQTT